MITNSSEVLIELEEILKANSLITNVYSALPVTPLAQEVNLASAYITFTNTVPRLEKNKIQMDGYDFHGFFLITMNIDCSTDKHLLYDIVDSVGRSILNDSVIWNKLVDRDLISIEYDNAEFYPKRSATLILEVTYRLACE